MLNFDSDSTMRLAHAIIAMDYAETLLALADDNDGDGIWRQCASLYASAQKVSNLWAVYRNY